jgi:hypothetical protein
MGFWSFLKEIFSPSGGDETELQQYRDRHGIKSEENIIEEKRPDIAMSNKPGSENYDVWEDIRNLRMNFFFGSWVTRKFRPVGEDKLKKQLDELEKKRQEEAARNKQVEGQ